MWPCLARRILSLGPRLTSQAARKSEVTSVAWVLNIGTGAGAATVARNEFVYFINQHPVLAPVLARGGSFGGDAGRPGQWSVCGWRSTSDFGRQVVKP